MTEPLLIFLAGLAGSMHCIGMCGGFACAMGGDSRGPAASVLRHLIYNAGRLASYCFIGTVVGHAGWLLIGQAGEAGAASAAPRALAALSGLLMIYIGLQFVGVIGAARAKGPSSAIEPLAQGLRRLVRTPGLEAPLAFGVLNGLLPCPLVYAFAAQAAASGGALPGLQVMAAFGLGTFPAMLAMGGFGVWVRRSPGSALADGEHPIRLRSTSRAVIDWRVSGVRIAGGFIVVLGLITLARGVLPIGAAIE